MEEAKGGQILLVVPEGDDGFTASFLERSDHPVTTCHGLRTGTECPLVHGEGCAWYEGAHGIVFSLDLSGPAHRAILRTYEGALAATGRDIPVRVVVPAASQVPEELDGALAWAGEPSVAELDGFAALVEAADRFA
jgi:hypothetical protein